MKQNITNFIIPIFPFFLGTLVFYWTFFDDRTNEGGFILGLIIGSLLYLVMLGNLYYAFKVRKNTNNTTKVN